MIYDEEESSQVQGGLSVYAVAALLSGLPKNYPDTRPPDENGTEIMPVFPAVMGPAAPEAMLFRAEALFLQD